MFDHFAKEKSDFLRKKDKSKKGCIDRDIKEIVDIINSKKDYYATSSCAGRIVLLEMKSKKALKNITRTTKKAQSFLWLQAKKRKHALEAVLNIKSGLNNSL
ncbi:hypothetical protein HYY71_03655 [Candidatus Woesearchaeota archaeon]|nr:hypothetical protein [Candidatus Woesearchaeota archaeon]